MKRQLVVLSLLMAAVLVMSVNLYAHHATAGNYDETKRITVKAVVVDIVWVNPHAQLYLEFKNDKGATEKWGLEMLSPGNLVRIGWSRNTFKKGDEILVQMIPAINDRLFASCGQIVSSEGKKYMMGQCSAPNGDVAILPVKEGYKNVEVKPFPEFPKGQNVTGPAIELQ
jgi:hypothetical protein